jgi:hypothetical protein
MEPDLPRPKPKRKIPTLVAVAILERAVMDVLIDVAQRDPDLNFVSLRYMVRETGLGGELIRAILRQLRDAGLAIYSAGLWGEDGRPAGAGYAASPKALLQRAELTKKPWKERT